MKSDYVQQSQIYNTRLWFLITIRPYISEVFFECVLQNLRTQIGRLEIDLFVLASNDMYNNKLSSQSHGWVPQCTFYQKESCLKNTAEQVERLLEHIRMINCARLKGLFIFRYSFEQGHTTLTLK